MSEGSLYPILHKMEEEGLVKTEKVNIGNRVRKYYAITKPGASVCSEKIEEFSQFVKTMATILDPAILSK